MRAKLVRVAMAAAACGAAIAGCGSGGQPAASPSPSADMVPVSANGTFGTDCAAFPASGQGSLTWMAREPLGIATAHSKILSELAHAIRVAGLTRTLDSARGITLFAPDNDAFDALGSGNVQTLLANKTDLRKVLEYHLVAGRITPAELASGASLKTLFGPVVRPARTDAGYEVNSAAVLCGNVQTANATVYILGAVLVP
jgi:uncharacterized surface protein with fasciclin (FAS1) repeats